MFPTLYGIDVKGAAKQWSVSVDGAVITVSHGKVGGKITSKPSKPKTGKNIGKANETTPEQQALKEAKALWIKKHDTDLYRESIEEARLVGDCKPMLAKNAKDGLPDFPFYVQPKLDGVRALVFREDSSKPMKMMSREANEYPLLELIDKELELIQRSFPHLGRVDGEAYKHGLDLNEIVSLIKNTDREERDELIYCIFDVPVKGVKMSTRVNMLDDLYVFACKNNLQNIKVIPCELVNNEEEFRAKFEEYVAGGYEGIMCRTVDGLYTYNHRSSALWKYKEMQDREYVCTGVEECEPFYDVATKTSYRQGTLLFKSDKGECREFGARFDGSYTRREDCILHPEKYIGKSITVQFQTYTAYGSPQFPVAKIVRDYE